LGKPGRAGPRGEGWGWGRFLPRFPQGLEVKAGVLLQSEGLRFQGKDLLLGPEEEGLGGLEEAVAFQEEDPGSRPPPMPQQPHRVELITTGEVHPGLFRILFFCGRLGKRPDLKRYSFFLQESEKARCLAL
jgi:hypothetical protein